MMMTRTRIISFVLAVIVIGGGINSAGGDAGQSSVMVIPARYTIVQLAFDVVRLRGVKVVSYQSREGEDVPLMHAWNASAGSWSEIGLDTLEGIGTGSRFTVVIGQDEQESAVLAEAVAGAVHQISTLNMASVVNGLDSCYGFSPREWRWLAARYRLQLEDLDYERRRYGRYGPPPGGPRRAAPAAETIQPEPVSVLDADRDIAEEIGAIEMQPAVEPVEAPSAPDEKGAAMSAQEPTVPVESEAASQDK